jgi:hypothetical protein
MKRGLIPFVLMMTLAFPWSGWSAPETAEQEVNCSFEDGHSIRLQYSPEPYALRKAEAWTPGNKPVALFLDTGISIGGVVLPVGAYGLYILPDKKAWTLIVNKSAKGGSDYDKTQDLARLQMESGDLGHQVAVPQLALAHTAPAQCSLRVYAGSTMAWGEIKEAGK